MKKRIFLILAMGIALFFGNEPIAKADIMDVDLSGVEQRFRPFFRRAERIWEQRIVGYNGNLPTAVKRQLGKLQISASTVDIDGPGGILGQAAPTQILRYGGNIANGRQLPNIAIAQAGFMQFDSADMDALLLDGTLQSVVLHEMGHVLGIGSLWDDNDLLNNSPRRDYIGSKGLAAYRRESGNRFALAVPVEQFGGPGTAGSHWDSQDPFFNPPGQNRSELMIGFIGPGEQKFISDTTWNSLRDMHFALRGDPNIHYVRTAGGLGVFPPKTTNPFFLSSMSVPEPTSVSLILLGTLSGMMLYRRRN
ncbi:MAG: PEP-CTERM sorting domain-containing protein [Pirellulaceae bacterium]|jgi:trimeric autotransporter adhesin|nr:PEP-CTERM sorting domain-containing protein [Pirellulaceae bacterium]